MNLDQYKLVKMIYETQEHKHLNNCYFNVLKFRLLQTINK